MKQILTAFVVVVVGTSSLAVLSEARAQTASVRQARQAQVLHNGIN